MTKTQLIKKATEIANKLFDKQMLDLIDHIKSMKNLHAQHKTLLLNYCEADRYRKCTLNT